MSASAMISFLLRKREKESRHCERSEAIHLATTKAWIASSLSLLAMTEKTTNGRNDMFRSITAVAAALAWTALATAPAVAADKVVLMLNWYVYGEHAPFYYGKAKGIFAAEGIELEIQEGRGSAATTQAVAAKTADFGYVDVPTMMRAAVKGAPWSPPACCCRPARCRRWALSRRTSRSPRISRARRWRSRPRIR
jgi:hypothetical protein